MQTSNDKPTFRTGDRVRASLNAPAPAVSRGEGTILCFQEGIALVEFPDHGRQYYMAQWLELAEAVAASPDRTELRLLNATYLRKLAARLRGVLSTDAGRLEAIAAALEVS